jgi:glyoxylase-like metal-dependent hydrolase (beta-lactamase superfamily II)
MEIPMPVEGQIADPALEAAAATVSRALADAGQHPVVQAFFDEPTFTASYVVYDPATKQAAIVDPVLDYDPDAGRTSTEFVDRIIAYVEEQGLTIAWLIETHAHADHISAAPYIQERLGGKLVIGEHIVTVQTVFGKLFNAEPEFARDGSQFDHLFTDGETFRLGEIEGIVLHVPGHTPADLAYVIGEAVFAGDTLFMPDYGTARADFPGGDAATLYRSIRRLLSLPREARLFMCHDYKAPGRDHFQWETTIGAERDGNVHVREGVTEAEFVSMRRARDKTLPVPRLILPSVQVNMRGGRLPEPEANGTSYIKIPLNRI